MSKIGIVIVNWNTGKLLRACLASLDRLPEKELIGQIVVVDNASTDASIAHAKSSSYTVPIHWILLNTNAGFAKANNIGMKYIQAHYRNVHMLLLNPDTHMQPGSLQSMVQALSHDDTVGIVGPMLRNADTSLQPSVRRFPTIYVLVFLFLKLHRICSRASTWRDYTMADFDYTKDSSVEQVMGAVFLIRDQVLARIGLLDERFWIWFEEVDYCKRARSNGWKVLYVASSKVIHHRAASFNQLVGLKRSVPFLKSSLIYSNKHLGVGSTIVLTLLFPVALALTIPASIAHIIYRNENTKKL